MTPQETFVTRLRRHRQRNRISLDEIAAETRVKRELLEALENNDLSEWPRGCTRAPGFAPTRRVVGLDPDDTVDEFCRLFPHGDRRANGTIREIAAIVASPSEYRDEFPHGQDRRAASAEPPAGSRSCRGTCPSAQAAFERPGPSSRRLPVHTCALAARRERLSSRSW